MKILLVNTFYYPEVKGGAEYSVKKLAETLQKSGNDVVVLAAGSIDKDEVIDGIRILRRKFNSLYHSYGKVNKSIFRMAFHRLLDFRNPMNRNVIENVLEIEKPDIVHTNNLYEITPIIWEIAQNYKIPVVHTIRDYYLMCYKTNLLRKDNSICGTPHIGCKVYQYINRRFTDYVDVLTAPSYMMIEEVEKRGFFKKAEHRVVYNACEFNVANVVKKCSNKKINDTTTFVYLGGFHEHKGIEILLNAFENLDNSNARLMFAGKGEKLEAIEEACKRDRRIQYVGFLNEKETVELLDKCDVLVCPSLWNEPFGRVTLDAYKNGLPVIASRIGALPEIVKDGITGVLVEPGSCSDLEKAMTRFINDNIFLKKCKDNIPEQLMKFGLDKQASEFEKLYKQEG